MRESTSPLPRLLPLYMVIFMGFVGYSLMITVFTPMIMQNESGIVPADASLSMRVILLGILLSLYPLGQFFASSVIGALSDRFGRKPLLLLTLLLTSGCYVLIAISLMIPSLSLLMTFSFIAGLSEANIAIAQSAIADVTTEKNRTHYFGYIYLSASSAYIVGPLLGGKLSDPSLGNTAMPFWIVFILLLLTAIWTLFKFQETKKAKSSEKLHYLQAFTNILHVFTSKRLRAFYGINFLLYLSIFGFFRCYPMYIVDAFQMNVSQESVFIAWVAVPLILANLGLTGLIARRLSPKNMTIYSAVFTGIWMIIIIVPSFQSALWVTLFFTSFGLSLCLPACASMLSLQASNHEQGSVMGNNQSLQVGAEALSGIIGGLLAAIFIKLSLIVLGSIALIGAFLLLIKKIRS